MADSDVLITAGTGTKIDTRTVGPGVDEHRQVMVIGDPVTNTGVATVNTAGQLYVLAQRDLSRISVTSTALTIATTTYSAGDQVGTLFTFANAARTTGGGGTIVGMTLIDSGDVLGAVDVAVFDSSVTLAADNAAFAISDADANKAVALIQLSGSVDIGSNRIAQATNLAVPYVCNGGTSLFGAVITRSNNAVFAANTDIQLVLYVERY